MTFIYGVDYYPEHWPVARWATDAKLMQEAGMNLVRLAEFAWARLEPRQDLYDFDWLDRAIDLMAEHGIDVILGTPTASPPPWLMAQDPTLFRVNEEGRRLTYGHRRAYCPNHPLYQMHTERIVTVMARRYAGHPAVVGLQIDNEFGDRCYCDICRGAFHGWLAERYDSLHEMNERWGTAFWSHIYTDWEMIPTPVATVAPHNPGLALDYNRFCSDSYVRYQRLQIERLRQYCPDRQRITHNFMGFGYPNINYFDLARDLDFVTWDAYWRHQWNMGNPAQASNMALSHDTMRGLKQQTFWVMEQQSGPGGWELVSESPKPGQLRLWAYNAIAHGADGIVFFRWRTARHGAEQYWHGILDHHGEPGRRYHEVVQMGQEMQDIGDAIVGAQTQADVAMILSYDSRFAFQIQANNPSFNHSAHFQEIYHTLHERQVTVDIVPPDADLTPYRLAIAPALHVVPEEVADNLRRFVDGGGILVLTARSGVKDETNTVVDAKLPGLFADLCGVTVSEYVSLAPHAQTQVTFAEPVAGLPATVAVSVWCDVLEVDGAEVLARYTEDYYAGKPAVTLNHYGKGQVLYVGTLSAPIYEVLTPLLLNLAGVQPVFTAPADVEVTVRHRDGRRLFFLLNHAAELRTVTLAGTYTDLLAEGKTVTDAVDLDPYGVCILTDLP
ncbi:cellulase family glycosylhydrolase [bacterium]|nr:cellulase family glycosylhydrolase [bacterium]